MLEIYIFTIIILIVMNCFIYINNINIRDITNNRMYLQVFDLFSVIILIAIMTHSSYSDLLNYEYHYDFSKSAMMKARFETGFNFYMLVCRYYLRLSFTNFKLLTYAICIFLIYNTYRRYTYNFSYFVMLFMLYEMFFDGLQIRNLIAISIVIGGLPYLLEQKTKGFFIYELCVLLASLFHSSSLALSLWGVVNIDFKKIFAKRSTRLIFESILLSGVVFLIYIARKGTLTNILSNISLKYLSEDFSNRILSHSSLNFGGSQIFLLATILIYCYYTKYVLEKSGLPEKISVCKTGFSAKNMNIYSYKEEFDIQILYKIIYISFISIFYVALCFMSTTYYRLLRNTCLIDIIALAIIMNYTPKKNIKIGIFLSTFVLLFFWIYYDLIVPDRLVEHIVGYLK